MSATFSPAAFQHEALPGRDWIRLVTVQPDLLGGNIDCTLHLFDANSRPEYIALSYLWGDPSLRYTININGQPLRIHESLWSFLLQTWRNKAIDYFWVDSLCLDQGSHSELNEQVQRMGDIYHQAHYVLSWLGESSDGAKALQTMAEFGQGGLQQLQPATTSDALRVRDALHQLCFDEIYWERVWVFQEVVCARRCAIVYGPIQMQFEDLVRHVRAASKRIYLPTRSAEDREPWIFKLASLRAALKHHRRLGFVALVIQLSNCTSTRQVDRIYGLLGLASRFDSDFDPQALEVNYDKSLDHVFWDIACLTAGSLQDFEYRGLLDLMPMYKNRKSTFIETAVITEKSLETYSKTVSTPVMWRSHARLAQKVHQVIASACNNEYQGDYADIYGDRDPEDDPWENTGLIRGIKASDVREYRLARVRIAWKAVVLSTLSVVHGNDTSSSAYIWTKGIHSQIASYGEPPWPKVGPFSQPGGLILGLTLFLQTIERDFYHQKVPDTPPALQQWFCPAHMPDHIAAEIKEGTVEVLAFTFSRFGTHGAEGTGCVAGNCFSTRLSLKIPDEGIVVEIRRVY